MNRTNALLRIMLPLVLISTVFLSVSCSQDEIDITLRYKNGVRKNGVIRLKDGTIRRLYWNYQGILVEAHTYKDDNILKKYRYRDRRLSKETFYKDNKKVKVKWYYLDGGLSDEREYKNGKPNGQWKYWDKRGHLISNVRYENGKAVKNLTR